MKMGLMAYPERLLIPMRETSRAMVWLKLALPPMSTGCWRRKTARC